MATPAFAPPRRATEASAWRWRIALPLAVLSLVVHATPALAHAHLKSTSPAQNVTLTAAPRELVLTFSESPTLPMSVLRLVGPDSQPVALGALGHTAGANTLGASIAGALAAGRYTVEWQTAGDDGHVQHGSFRFTIAAGASGITTAPPPAGTITDTAHRGTGVTSTSAPGVAVGLGVVQGGMDPSSPVYVLIRWMQFAALLLLIGAVAFRWWVLPRAGVALDDASRVALASGAATSGLRGAWLLALTTLARLVAQRATMHDLPGALTPSMGPMLLHTAWGHGWLLEVLALIVVIVMLLAARRNAAAAHPWRLAAAAVVALAYVPALSGHAVADRTFPPFTLLFDGIHVLAAGAWLGTLAVLLVVGLPVARRTRGASTALALMVNSFSPVALTCAGVLVFTGIVATRVHVGSWAAFTMTSYGRTILIKLAVVILVVCVATYNWRRVRPALSGSDDAAGRRLARSARLEVALALVVLLVTAVLVALPTPADLLR